MLKHARPHVRRNAASRPTVTENQKVSRSAPSCDDYSKDACDPIAGRALDAHLPWHKPSVFYFRRELREASTRERAMTVALILLSEYSQLRAWSGEQGIIPDCPYEPAAECMKAAIVDSASHAQAILLGLFLCHELEQAQNAVCEAGLMPPKWIVMPKEAEEKGWACEDDRSQIEEVSHV